MEGIEERGMGAKYGWRGSKRGGWGLSVTGGEGVQARERNSDGFNSKQREIACFRGVSSFHHQGVNINNILFIFHAFFQHINNLE